MFKKLAVAAFLGLLTVPSFTQNIQCPERPPNDGSNACASTSYVDRAVAGIVSGVSSFNGRTGVVVPAANDYSFAQLSGKPTTLAGYGITDARTQLTGNATYHVNGNAAVTNAITAAGNATLHFAGGSGTTNNTTAAGNAVLHFAATPVTIYVGATITDSTSSVIPSATTVTAVTSTTVTMSANATGGGVGNGDTIQWSLSTFFVGQQITDATSSVIPNGTTITAVTPTTVTISNNATGGGVGSGDTILWQAVCGPTGALTCGFGSDTTGNGASATPYRTSQKAVNVIVGQVDGAAAFAAIVVLAHGASQNYKFGCFAPVIGQSSFILRGDSTARTAVTIVGPAGDASIQAKDLCIPEVFDLGFSDAPTNDTTQYIALGTGGPGHIDIGGVTFYSCTICTFMSAAYTGSSISVITANNQIVGGGNAALAASTGGLIDFAQITNSFTVSDGLTFGGGFAQIFNGGMINGIVKLGATGTFGNPSGAGSRCFIDSAQFNIGGNGTNPNAYFPGATDCVIQAAPVGTISLQNGSGATSTLVMAWTSTAPTISAGFCATSPSIATANGVAAFDINVGTACAGSVGTLGMPTAKTGWVCQFHNVTNPATNVVEQTGGATNTVTLTNYVRTTGVAGNFTASDHIRADCAAY